MGERSAAWEQAAVGDLHSPRQRHIAESEGAGAADGAGDVGHAIVQHVVHNICGVPMSGRPCGCHAPALVHRHVDNDAAGLHLREVFPLNKAGALAPGTNTAPITRSARWICSRIVWRSLKSTVTFGGMMSSR